jgi:transposase
MQTITTIGLDIAKSVFQVHGVDAGGKVIVRRQLKRRYVLTFFQKLSPCLVGIEACASAHHWSRELRCVRGSFASFLERGGLAVACAADGSSGR